MADRTTILRARRLSPPAETWKVKYVNRAVCRYVAGVDTTRHNAGFVVRAGETYQGKQGPDYTPGISAENVGAKRLWLGSVTLPPGGGRTKAHVHESHESAFYMMSGDGWSFAPAMSLSTVRSRAQVTTFTCQPASHTWR